MSDVNKQLLDALKEMVSIVEIHSKATDNNFAWAELSYAHEAIAAAEQAQQAEPVAWQPGKRPPSVFKTSEAGRQYVADFFANALRRHDFSSYIKGHLAADFACALSDGLHAMQTAQPQAVPDGYALVPIEPTEEMLAAGQQEWLDSAGADPSFDIYCAMLAASQKP